MARRVADDGANVSATDRGTCTGRGHFAALILARGGSKGIKLKNTRVLAGQPLITWALRAAYDSGVFDSVWVSTDHDDVARVSREWGAKVFRRGAWCARDEASSSDAIKEFLDAHPEVEMVAHIQCTAPCLHPWHFRQPTRLIRNGDYDSVFSVTRRHIYRWKEVPKDSTDKVQTTPLNFRPDSRQHQRDWPGELYENGAFYMTTREAFMEAGCTQGGRTTYYEIDPRYSVDIDTDIDWMLAEQRVIKSGYFGKIQPQGVKLAVFCAEGVLLDNQFFIVSGEECRSYNVSDTVGIKALKDNGVEVRLIAENKDPFNQIVAKKFGLPMVVESSQKFQVLNQWRQEHGISWKQVAFMGRDINDMACIKKAGVSGAPSDAYLDIQTSAKFVTKLPGGRGAVREFCDHVILLLEKARSAMIRSQENDEKMLC